MAELKRLLKVLIYRLFCCFPLRKRVLGSSFYGAKYENNAKYILDEMHNLKPEIPLIWEKNRTARFCLPPYIKGTQNTLRTLYYYATSQVVVNSHQLPLFFKRRKKQLVIIVWHGGLGMKKIANDVISRDKTSLTNHTAKNVSFYVSNSSYRNNLIRNALMFNGEIKMLGCPKNDILVRNDPNVYKRIRELLNVKQETKLLFYAPTYRIDPSLIEPYKIDFQNALEACSQRFGGDWIGLVHWHPHQKTVVKMSRELYGQNIIDVTAYNDMQELILGCDVFVSDYSSGIFDAALRRIPCFVFASDYDEYSKTQGLYYDIKKELPFPFAESNQELIKNIRDFNEEDYLAKWDSFCTSLGMVETGHSSQDVAKIIIDYLSEKGVKQR